mgnify:CR=1 FL=1|jgi:hypothetical protein|tara:strand:+ start:6189 stop:6440 length:252 start_codon:yes stop_codon:yes gene_type:complete
MIGTSTLPEVDSLDYPKVNDPNSWVSSTNNKLPDPGYGLAVDGRRGRRLLQLDVIRAGSLPEEELIGRRISDNKFPRYTELQV